MSRNHISSLLKNCEQTALLGIHDVLELERRPFAHNHDAINSKRDQLMKAMSFYRQNEIGSVIQMDPYRKLLGPNEYQSELSVIAHVLSYLNVAYQRFADYVSMKVEQQYQNPLLHAIPAFAGNILTGEGAEERCAKYMEASPEVVELRRDLWKKLEILQIASDILDNVSCQAK
jgi:hypothetical protein